MWGIVRATARVPTPLHPTPALTMRRHYGIPLVVIVRAGVGWSGVGTLAVALGVGLLLSPPVASPSRARGASFGRPGGGFASFTTSSITQSGSRGLFRSP